MNIFCFPWPASFSSCHAGAFILWIIAEMLQHLDFCTKISKAIKLLMWYYTLVKFVATCTSVLAGPVSLIPHSVPDPLYFKKGEMSLGRGKSSFSHTLSHLHPSAILAITIFALKNHSESKTDKNVEAPRGSLPHPLLRVVQGSSASLPLMAS